MYFRKICKNALFVLLMNLMIQTLAAQSDNLRKIDSLIANAKDDTTRINLNLFKLDLLANINLDTTIQLAKQQLKKAEEIHFYHGIFDLRIKLSNSYSFKGDFESAKENLQFLETFLKPTDTAGLADVYGAYGMMYGVKAVYDTSIMYIEKAIPINKNLKRESELSANYLNIAIGYEQLANFPKALEYMQMALEIARAKKNETDIARILVNMGIAYVNIGDSKNAEAAYLEAADKAVKANVKMVELYAYTNLSSLFVNNAEWEKGYEYAMKSVNMAKLTGDMGIQGASMGKAAVSLAHLNRYDEAIKLSNQAIIVADSSGQPLNKFQAYGSMGDILYLQKKYKEAIPFFEKAFLSVKGATNYDRTTAEYYKQFSECYEKTGNYVKALSNYKFSAEITDSINRKDNIRKTTEQAMNYEFAKKQEVASAEHKKDIELQRTKQIALTVGLVLLFLLGLLALVGFKNKQKANKILREQKRKIESALTELKSTQAQLVQSEKMASLGELTAGIAHEIQNPLNFVNNFSDINKELLGEMREEMKQGNLDEADSIANDVIENEEKINHHGKRADAIVKGMLQHSRSSSGKKEPTDINALADEYLRLSYHGMRAKDKTFNCEMKTEFDTSLPKINVVPQDIGRVILNLINNAFYACNERSRSASPERSRASAGSADGYLPTVTIITRKEDNQVVIMVKDNGNGIPSNIKDKIFQPFFTTKPTGQGTGLGLSLSYDIITKEHNGTIKVESEEGKGTEFTMSLPGKP